MDEQPRDRDRPQPRRRRPDASSAASTTAAARPARTIQQAAMAVATGVADVVVCYRALNERSRQRFGAGVQAGRPSPTAESAHFGWYAPFGLLTPAAWVAMFAQRYMHEYGATSEDFGRVVGGRPQARGHQPDAWFYEQPDHARGPPELALDRRAAAPARLLPGERRRRGARRDLPRAGARPAAEARRDPRRGPGHRPTTSR